MDNVAEMDEAEVHSWQLRGNQRRQDGLLLQMHTTVFHHCVLLNRLIELGGQPAAVLPFDNDGESEGTEGDDASTATTRQTDGDIESRASTRQTDGNRERTATTQHDGGDGNGASNGNGNGNGNPLQLPSPVLTTEVPAGLVPLTQTHTPANIRRVVAGVVARNHYVRTTSKVVDLAILIDQVDIRTSLTRWSVSLAVFVHTVANTQLLVVVLNAQAALDRLVAGMPNGTVVRKPAPNRLTPTRHFIVRPATWTPPR